LILLFFAALSASVAHAQGAAASQGLTLSQCYSSALANNETIAIKNGVVAESKARYLRAIGTVMPAISYDLIYTKQGIKNTVGIPSYVAAKNSSQMKFTFNQPLFSGFREFAGLSASQAEQRQRIQEEIRARQTLFGEVASAFFYAAEFIEAEKITAGISTLYSERIDYLKGRVSVGRSRQSEMVNTLMLLNQNSAMLESIANQKEDTFNTLEFLTGIRGIRSINYEEYLDTGTQTEDYYERKVLSRPDILAAYEEKIIAEKQVTIAGADLLPEVNVYGDYFTHRTGGQSEIYWDANLAVGIPLLPFVGPLGERKEAKARADEAALQYSLMKRTAEMDVKNAFADFRSAEAVTGVYKKVLENAEENYTLQKRDYELNLINNLDMLSAIQSLRLARLDYLHSAYEARRLYWNLIAAVGENL